MSGEELTLATYRKLVGIPSLRIYDLVGQAHLVLGEQQIALLFALRRSVSFQDFDRIVVSSLKRASDTRPICRSQNPWIERIFAMVKEPLHTETRDGLSPIQSPRFETTCSPR